MLRKYLWFAWFTVALALAVGTAWADDKHSTKKSDCCEKGCCDKGCCTAEAVLPGPCCPICEFFQAWLNDAKEAQKIVTKVYPVDKLASVLSLPMTPAGAVAASGEEPDGAGKLIDLIVSIIDPDSWDSCGGQGTIDLYPLGRSLIVSQTEEVHAQIARLLNALEHCCTGNVMFGVGVNSDDGIVGSIVPNGHFPMPMPVPFGFVGAVPPPPLFMMPPPHAIPPMPTSPVAAQPGCPGQCVAMLPAPETMPQANGKATEYQLEMRLIAKSADGHGDKVQVLPRCRVLEGQDAVLHLENGTPQGRREVIDVHCQIGPCVDEKACMGLTVETGTQAVDDREEIVREHRVSVSREVKIGEKCKPIALDTNDAEKAQSWLEFTVCKVVSETLPMPKPCAANGVAQCTADAPASMAPPRVVDPVLTRCGATLPGAQPGWVLESESDEDGAHLLVSKDDTSFTCKVMQLKMSDGAVIRLGTSPSACRVTVASEQFHGSATRVVVLPSMDTVVLEGDFQLDYGKSTIQAAEGSVSWNLKDGSLECHVAKVPEK